MGSNYYKHSHQQFASRHHEWYVEEGSLPATSLNALDELGRRVYGRFQQVDSNLEVSHGRPCSLLASRFRKRARILCSDL
jgi:hypothetical protein